MSRIYLIFLLIFNPFTYISEINQTQLDALKAYQDGEYMLSILKYRYLTDSLGLENENILMNLAHAYYKNKSWEQARAFYDRSLQSKKNQNQSICFTQLGILADIANRKPEALDYFKKAIRKYPNNFDARYNYELLKKRLKQLEPPKKDSSNQQKKDEEKEKNKGGDPKNQREDENGKENDIKEQKAEGENQRMAQKQLSENGKDKKKQLSKNEKGTPGNIREEDFKKMELNLEKANMILEAMKNQEIQYLQQKKKQGDGQQDSKDKPDW